jgi:hypothetical protein
MKRITVSLPDDLAERVKTAAGGGGQVSSYVAAALTDYQEKETLQQIVDDWQAETPTPVGARKRAALELDKVGLPSPRADDRLAS